MVNADNLRKANPWMPISDKMDLAVLGKLGEELGELVSAVNRCIIQGVDESEPVTGKINRDWLTEELADVLVTVGLASDHFNVDIPFTRRRIAKKRQHLRDWFALINQAFPK